MAGGRTGSYPLRGKVRKGEERGKIYDTTQKSVYNENMSKILRGLVIIFLLGTGVAAAISVRAQENAPRYFPETGHTIRGKFRAFYEATPDALLLFGYPITEAFTNPQGVEVQYFQRARFEYDPASPANTVRLTPLGQLVYKQEKEHIPANTPPNPTACQHFADTGQQLCYGFLAFWKEHQGAIYLGNPISPLERDGDRLVQYLEYARLEWHPEAGGQGQFVLTNLGEVYFRLNRENPRLLLPQNTAFIGQNTLLEMQVHAFVTKASVSQKDEQTLYIIVRDQKRQPLEGATAAITVHYPDGRSVPYIAPHSTNAYGFTDLTFPVDSSQPGFVEVSVEVTAPQGSLKENTRTSFRIWY